MTDTSGTLVWRAEHAPFGGIYALPVSTISNNLRFPGQYYDSETTLGQNWFRDYDAKIGRYREVDVLTHLPLKPKKCKSNLKVFSYPKMFPLTKIDFNGATELVGFPSSAVGSLSGSVTNALRGLKTCCNCPKCKDAFNQLLKATIFFDPNEESCGVTFPYAQSILFAPSLHNGVYIALPFFTTGSGVLPGGNCCAAQTFAEEALHLAGASDSNNEAGQIVSRCLECR